MYLKSSEIMVTVCVLGLIIAIALGLIISLSISNPLKKVLIFAEAMEGSDNANKSKDRATNVEKQGKDAIKEVRNLYEEKKKNMLKAIEEGKVVENIKVMADTIASIAEQSSEAVNGIQDTIIKVQNAFKNLAGNGSDVLRFINENVDPQFENVGKQYYDDSDFVTQMSEEIASMSEELTATIDQVSQAVQSMTTTAQKSSEHTETIVGSIDETTKAISLSGIYKL